jgi:UPF0755 protein
LQLICKKNRIKLLALEVSAHYHAGMQKNDKANIFRRRAGRGFKTPLKDGAVCIGAIAALCLAFCAIYFFGIRSCVREDVSYEVARGANVAAVAADLSGRGLVFSADSFKAIVRGFGGGGVQAGVYDLPRGASVWRIARMLSKGDIASTVVIIPEGLTTKQIVGLLEENKFLNGNACPPQPSKERSNGGCPPDGELFPDTYRVAKGTKRAAVVELMQKKMSEIRRGWESSGRHAPRPLRTWNDVVTLASIVQKETPKVSEMPLVASVYINRLRTRMRLQADPTVVYVLTGRLGDMRGEALLSGHLQLDSPFNTYKNYGLPPSPIANPGRAAISAVINPADTNYLFFVADGQGGHNFSDDFESHKENRARWREIKKNNSNSR